MKLGWGLVANPDALWARVLRDKYACGNQSIPVVQRRHSESHVWRAIRGTWDDLGQHLRWRMGDGSNINFWSDVWLHSGTVLANVALSPVQFIDTVRSVADYFDQRSGAWKLAEFVNLLPAHVVSEILTMPPPAPDIGRDRVIWGLTSDGNFTSKSAYDALTSSGSNQTRDWKYVWGLKGPFKVCNFMWRLLHNGLWVNYRRWQSNLTATPTCPLCNEEDETPIHLFRDCAMVKPLWLHLVDQRHASLFFVGDLRGWVMNNLQTDLLNSIGRSGPPDFALLLWAIWKSRANFVFQGVPFDLRCMVPMAMKTKLDYTHSLRVLQDPVVGGTRRYEEVQIGWEPPSASWFKCNTDGSVRGTTNSAGCGGVCRDHRGNWLFGFSRNLGSSNVLWAELWAMFTMVTLAWERGLRKIVVESDSLVAVNLVNEGCAILHPYASLVNQIRVCLARDWDVVCVHVRREANQVADCLANASHGLGLGLHCFESPPPSCLNLLLFDRMGVTFPRSILV